MHDGRGTSLRECLGQRVAIQDVAGPTAFEQIRGPRRNGSDPESGRAVAYVGESTARWPPTNPPTP
jgi:hypothetical protein